MRRKTVKKFNFFVIFIITFIILTSVINIYAETASPENTELPEAIATPTPTPVNNVISTIGDFSLNAMFADKRIVDEDLSINVKKLNINDISPEIIQAVRAKDGDKDIFLYFKLTLQLNGRDTVQNSVIDIEINGNEIIAEYQSISLFRVNNNQVTKVTDEETDGNIKFSASELGTFLVAEVCYTSYVRPGRTAWQHKKIPGLETGRGFLLIMPVCRARSRSGHARNFVNYAMKRTTSPLIRNCLPA